MCCISDEMGVMEDEKEDGNVGTEYDEQWMWNRKSGL
jgi:hypothetical protein